MVYQYRDRVEYLTSPSPKHLPEQLRPLNKALGPNNNTSHGRAHALGQTETDRVKAGTAFLETHCGRAEK